MRKLWLSLLLVGCAATSEGLVPPTPVDLISPEADLTAPGMIPVECEALLQKSQAWGYRPGENWVPKDIEMAKEVAEFLGTFSLVPENTHRYYSAWAESPNSADVSGAQEKIKLLERAQDCNPSLTLTILEGMMQFSWSRQDRQIVGKSVHRFVLNQQARKSFLLPRVISLRALELAYLNGYLKGDKKKLEPISSKLKKFRTQGNQGEDPMSMEVSLKNELQFSDEIRADLSRLLPLP